jgi:hypothetical protein
MKLKIFSLALLFTISSVISAQFVGEAPTPVANNKSPMGQKAGVFIKFGGAMPLSPFSTLPKRSVTPQYGTGTMGASTGFFVEAGMGLSFLKPEQKVGFYYYPILLSYWKTPLDWTKFGGFVTDKATYSTKPVSAIDIGQRYGVVVTPMKDLFIAAYYRPGLIVPFDFEVNYKYTATAETFLFTGTMATGAKAPIFILSSTPGLSVRYKMASIIFEGYFVKPTYTVTYKDSRYPTIPGTATNTKIPVKMFVISLALGM